MSRNGSGVYVLPATNPVVPGSTISTVWANGTMNDIATALTGSLAADGQTPMTGNLNANSNKITNLVAGTVTGNSVEFAQFSTPTFTGDVTCNSTGFIKLPAGTTAQRPALPATGEVRFNTTLGQYEGYNSGLTGQTITSITHVTLVATLTTAATHGLTTGDVVVISGASPAEYNGTYNVTVTSDTVFTYTMASNPATNAVTVGSYTYGAWAQIGGGATGGGTDQVFVENSTVITTSYVLPVGKNASSVGPITINSGKVVTIPSTQRWVIL